jgi:Arc/MetJ family transcription regulator
MAMTSVDIDLEILEEAGKALGTATKKDTINAALREVLRIRAAQELMDMLQSGDTFEVTAPEDIRARAWGYAGEGSPEPPESSSAGEGSPEPPESSSASAGA